MLAQDVIEPSTSAWASPVVLVKKKYGTRRFCIDYRRLNEVTIEDAYPLPRIKNNRDALQGACWFTRLDLASGYRLVEVHPKDREKSTFCTKHGLHQFKVMPFGLCNAPGTFECLTESVLEGCKGSEQYYSSMTSSSSARTAVLTWIGSKRYSNAS